MSEGEWVELLGVSEACLPVNTWDRSGDGAFQSGSFIQGLSIPTLNVLMQSGHIWPLISYDLYDVSNRGKINYCMWLKSQIQCVNSQNYNEKQV